MSIDVMNLESEIIKILSDNGGATTLQFLYQRFAGRVRSSYPIYLTIKSLEKKGVVKIKVNGLNLHVFLSKKV